MENEAAAPAECHSRARDDVPSESEELGRDWPDPGTPTGRVWVCVQLMARQTWERGRTGKMLAEAWGVQEALMRRYAQQASQWIKFAGSREGVMDVVRAAAAMRLDGAENKDFVAVARLLVDTVGGFTQKQEITVKEIAGLPVRQRQELVILELVKDDWASAFFAEARAAHLAGRAVVTEGIDAGDVVLPLTDGSGEGITSEQEETDDTCDK